MILYEAVELVSHTANDYAKAYAREALRGWHRMSEAELRMQLLYVLSNISHWRTPGAKEARQLIRQATKG